MCDIAGVIVYIVIIIIFFLRDFIFKKTLFEKLGLVNLVSSGLSNFWLVASEGIMDFPVLWGMGIKGE